VYLGGYSNRTVGAALTCSVTGLQARTEYYCRVRAENGAGIGTGSATQKVSAAAIGLSPGSLTYTGTFGGANPAAQTVIVTNLGNRGFAFTNTTTYSAGAAGWWTVTPATGSVNGLMAVTITGAVSLTGINAGTYYATNAVISADATNSPQTFVATLTVGKANQAITNFTPASGSAFATTSTVVLTAQASSGLTVTFEVVSGPGHLVGASLTFTNAGTVSIRASQAGDMNYFAAPSLTNTFNISKATASVTLSNLTQVYDGAAKTVAATTVPEGLTIDVTYDGYAWAPTNVGSYALTGTVNDTMYQGTTNGTLFITKATTTVTLNNLGQTYDGTARSVTATTVPADLTVIITYNGSATAPVNAGSYAVTGTINNAIYQGVANGTLVVAKANQAITFPTIPDQMLTNQVSLAATASSGLPVIFAVVSGPAVITGGTILSFAGTGQVNIVASQAGNANWNAASPVTNTFNVTAIPIMGVVNADFDGDRKADPAVYNENTGTWIVKLSSGGYVPVDLTGFLGGPGWAPAPADYDGDGKADPAVYQEATGIWKGKLSDIGYAVVYMDGLLGGPGFGAVSADYNGDGLADPAVYDRTDGTWMILMSSGGYAAPLVLTKFLGGTGWNAVPGDYDGDGKADPAVMDPATGRWIVLISGSGYIRVDLPYFLGGL